MKTCPVCQRPYADETMIYCLADGTQLVNVSRRLDLDATWRLTPARVEPPPTEIAPTVAARQTGEGKPQTTIEYSPAMHAARQVPSNTATVSGRSVLPWIFLLAIVVVVAGSGIIVAVILTRNRNAEAVQVPTTTQQTAVPANTNTNSVGTPGQQPGAPSVSATKANSNKTQALSPTRKTTLVPERRRRDTGTGPGTVTIEKKKVEPPKPTGESFIPVKPPR
jgi:hypothetical protein